MIHAVFIFNTQGTPRLTKYYTPLTSSVVTTSRPNSNTSASISTSNATPGIAKPIAPSNLPSQIFKLISTRPSGLCNFLDAPDLHLGGDVRTAHELRVVYRCYATLYFVFVVDGAESELGVLDLIQVFVESLDRAFENVCELDLVFHFDEVHHILAEVIQGGLVLETNVDDIYTAVRESTKARKTSYTAANPLSLGGGPGGTGVNRGASLQTPLGWLTGKVVGH